MAFSEFFCQTTASNLNAGSTTADAASLTYVSSVGAGWVSTTGVFTVASGNPSSDGVLVGDFASVYVTSGATVATFVARVTARDTTTITVSLTAKSGTAPTTDALGATTLKIGGAWKGPNAAVAFPFAFITNTLTNAAGDFPRVNFKSGTNYSITATMTHANAGPIFFQGYTSSAGDGGRATIDGGTGGSGYVLLTLSATNCELADIIFQNNGGSSTSIGVNISGTGSNGRRLVVNSVRGFGLQIGIGRLIECEAYSCNQSNAANLAGFNLNDRGGEIVRCIAHDNTGSNNNGFVVSIGGRLVNCIAESNGLHGILVAASTSSATLYGCDTYSNGTDGVRIGSGSTVMNFYAENCNFIKNGGYGIKGGTTGTINGYIVNCGYGVGTQANTSGTTNSISTVTEIGAVTYASGVTPWVDPANGDFRIILPTAKGTGRGAFTETAASYAGTVGYPDIGAAQHLEAAAATSHTFA